MPPSSGFTLPNGVHCSPDLGSGEELSFSQNQLPPSASAGLGSLPFIEDFPADSAASQHVRWPWPYAGSLPFIGGFPADSAASQRVRWPRPYAGWSPLYRRFFPAQIPPCFPAGHRIYTGFPVLPEHRCFYLSFPSVLGVFSFPGQGIPDEPPNILPDVRIPEWKERRLPRQCNSQKGKFITDSSQGFLPQPTQWCRVRKSLKQRLLAKFIRYA